MSFISSLGLNGYAVIENFFDPKPLKEEVKRLLLEAPEPKAIFSSKNTNGDSFKSIIENKNFQELFDSTNEIKYFYEDKALLNGKLLYSKEDSVNKIGHGLHLKNKVFQEFASSDMIKRLCLDLGYFDPIVLQSMVIVKPPYIGGEVIPHRDNTFLYTEPETSVGLWFALNDSTLENGCLQFAPGSHNDIHDRRWVRFNGGMIFTGSDPKSNTYSFTPVPVKAGSLIIIHSNVLHMSLENKSSQPRHAFTFHIIEQRYTIHQKTGL